MKGAINGMVPSIDKTLRYLNCVSKQAHHIEYEDREYDLTPKDSFIIRKATFFRDECQSCGQCCRNWDTIFFPMDMPEMRRRSEAGQEQYTQYIEGCKLYDIRVDGQTYHYYSMPPMSASESHDIWTHRHTVLNCRWIYLDGTKKYCKIHEFRCITCGFPHMELYANTKENGGFLSHKQFGRNWMLGCPVDIKRDPMDQETLDSNIYWLSRLQEVADYFQVDTYLPEVIDYLKTVDVNNLPDNDIEFTRASARSKKLFKI